MIQDTESIFRFITKRFTGAFATLTGLLLAFFAFSTFLGFVYKSIPDEQELFLPIKVLPNEKGAILPLKKDSDLILQIDIEGVIGLSKDSQNKSATLQKILNQPYLQGIKQERIKGIFIKINSRGGSSTECSEMYQDIMSYKKEHNLPIHVWISDICASAGYYLACTGDYISAQSMTMIGSVGVFFPTQFNFYNLMQKLGIEGTTVSAGKNKIPFPMYSPMGNGTDSYNDIIKMANDTYQTFISVVDQARASHGLTSQKLIEYGAAIYGSLDAQKLGYIDASNTRYFDALNYMKTSLALNDTIQIISFAEKKAFYANLKGKLKSIFDFLGDTNDPPFTLQASIKL